MSGVPGWSKWLLGWIGGLATAGLLAAAAGLYLVFSGAFDASAMTPHRALVGWAAHTTMIHSVRARAGPEPQPFAPTAAQVQAGLKLYDSHCVVCHGGPGLSRAPFAKAMTPTAPFLLDSARRWSPAELHYIIRRGVKMTAMPAWGEVIPDQDAWALVAFLEAMPKIPAAEYQRMRGAPGIAQPTGAPAPPGGAGSRPG